MTTTWKIRAGTVEMIKPGSACRGCGNLVSCICEVRKTHGKKCRYRIASELSFELACEHGFEACPKCDPCTCKKQKPVRPIP